MSKGRQKGNKQPATHLRHAPLPRHAVRIVLQRVSRPAPGQRPLRQAKWRTVVGHHPVREGMEEGGVKGRRRRGGTRVTHPAAEASAPPAAVLRSALPAAKHLQPVASASACICALQLKVLPLNPCTSRMVGLPLLLATSLPLLPLLATPLPLLLPLPLLGSASR